MQTLCGPLNNTQINIKINQLPHFAASNMATVDIKILSEKLTTTCAIITNKQLLFNTTFLFYCIYYVQL